MKKMRLFLISILLFVGFTKLQAQTGKYFVLDGTTTYMTVPHHADLNIGSGESKTITLWIKRSAPVQGTRLISKRTEASPQLGYEITVRGGSEDSQAGQLFATYQGPATVNYATAPVNYGAGWSKAETRLQPNTWHHIAVVFDQSGSATVCKIYIDGILDTESTTGNKRITPADLSNTVDLAIGTQSITNTNKFSGSMDDIRIFSFPMNTEEVQADMSATVDANTPNLIAAWDFENVSGNVVPDISGNGHNGTIMGTVVLPVSFISFKARLEGKHVNIGWVTVKEKNNSYFEVLRSNDGKSFQSITTVKGSGNSDQTIVYQYIDNKPIVGINYYKLKQYDNDGKSEEFNQIVAVKYGLDNNKLMVSYTGGILRIRYSPTEKNVILNLRDVIGKTVLESKLSNASIDGYYELPVNLKKGVYVLSVQDGAKLNSVKLLN